ncbi:hypothetical protein GCM10011529_15200 [Polymorphobacter glacialis]|uniref:Streptomycin biosynthesis protein StrF domain-containing protein n=1 Tax=Sandarakinorhabdus glacialis TaxID=1614636 RepID=A0A916ZQX1_9SPHN|nr:glycosyltransferase [Polymorphobacter glacialis]GGE09838.1 hypothetical protein GCM10011529_15200 [Polymorphobacter glacialis]
MSHRSVVIAAAVNNEQILADTLALSPDLTSGRVKFIPVRAAESASAAYNTVLSETTADLVIFVHQDVYLPAGWVALILSEALRLDQESPDWAVMGVYGITREGKHLGRIWSGDQQLELVGDGGLSGAIASLDEVVLILRTNAGLSFDPDLPHFHMYGTDIVQMAASAGRSAHVIQAPVVHNTIPVVSLAGGFTAGYRFLQKKWAVRLPIVTSMTTITHAGLPLFRARARHWWYSRRMIKRSGIEPPRVTDVVALAKAVGYESIVNA